MKTEETTKADLSSHPLRGAFEAGFFKSRVEFAEFSDSDAMAYKAGSAARFSVELGRPAWLDHPTIDDYFAEFLLSPDLHKPA